MRDELAEQARRWVDASCAAQRLTAKVSDPVVLGQVVSVLGGDVTKRGQSVRTTTERPPTRRRRRRAA